MVVAITMVVTMVVAITMVVTMTVVITTVGGRLMSSPSVNTKSKCQETMTLSTLVQKMSLVSRSLVKAMFVSTLSNYFLGTVRKKLCIDLTELTKTANIE